MKDLRHLTWISIALSLFIGGIVTVLFLRRNYMPVQLMQSLSKQFGLRFDAGANEYSFLQGTIQQIFMKRQICKRRFTNIAIQYERIYCGVC